MKQHSQKLIALALMLLIGKMTLSAQEQTVWSKGEIIIMSNDQYVQEVWICGNEWSVLQNLPKCSINTKP